MGALGKTLLVLTADHGEGLWDHGERAHGHELYQEQIHIPLIVHYPVMKPNQARHVTDPVSNVDVAPTILRAVGIDPPETFQGADLEPLTRSEDRRRSPAGAYSELALDGRNIDAIRLGPMKLIRYRKGSTQVPNRRLLLFDLTSDPGETVNRAGDAEGTTRKLVATLREWRAWTAAAAGRGKKVQEEDLPEHVRENLKALGYLQ